MKRTNNIGLQIECLFPQFTKVCFSPALNHHAKLLTEELAGTENMVEGRMLEFRHGRYCAHAVLAMLGVREVAVPRGSNREPLWPQDIVGSISHSGKAAAAVAISDKYLAGIGLDIESSGPLSENLISMICLPEESVGNNGLHAKLLFSIKEAIYKCVFPTVGEFIDFREVKVCLNEEACTFTASPKRRGLDLIERVEGGYSVIDGMVISGAWLAVNS